MNLVEKVKAYHYAERGSKNADRKQQADPTDNAELEPCSEEEVGDEDDESEPTNRQPEKLPGWGLQIQGPNLSNYRLLSPFLLRHLIYKSEIN